MKLSTHFTQMRWQFKFQIWIAYISNNLLFNQSLWKQPLFQLSKEAGRLAYCQNCLTVQFLYHSRHRDTYCNSILTLNHVHCNYVFGGILVTAFFCCGSTPSVFLITRQNVKPESLMFHFAVFTYIDQLQQYNGYSTMIIFEVFKASTLQPFCAELHIFLSFAMLYTFCQQPWCSFYILVNHKTPFWYEQIPGPCLANALVRFCKPVSLGIGVWTWYRPLAMSDLMSWSGTSRRSLCFGGLDSATVISVVFPAICAPLSLHTDLASRL